MQTRVSSRAFHSMIQRKKYRIETRDDALKCRRNGAGETIGNPYPAWLAAIFEEALESARIGSVTTTSKKSHKLI
ncbi:hypothetical protein BVI1335_2360003 [Burkholderia vietnamiensis]|nr:hypothetical protein BVI1335_2360003 [Burkholderia vietnamiensis]